MSEHINPAAKADWLICVPPLADVDNRPPKLQVLFKCHNEAQKSLLEMLGTRPSHVTNYPSTSWDQKYGSLGHLFRVDGKMVAFGKRLYLDLCTNQASIQRVHIVATESGAYLVIKVVEFIKYYGHNLQYDSARLDSTWTLFLANPRYPRPLASNDLYRLIQTVTIIQPSLPSPRGFARLLWALTRPDIYDHMNCNLMDHDGSENPHIQVICMESPDVEPMTFGNSEYLTITNYESKTGFFKDLLRIFMAKAITANQHEQNLMDTNSLYARTPSSPPETPGQSVSKQYPKLNLPTKLFALVIGIDKYQHYKPHLVGAAKDANDIEYFLKDSLFVPPNHITKLLNGDATKGRITEEIQFLCTRPDIQKDRGDAILIYFAGHGARDETPEGWSSADGQIEMICPVDMSLREAGDPRITGIPDIVLNKLISQLAEEKGNNITVILDCGYSSNKTYDVSVTANVRGIDNPPSLSLSGNWDDGILRARRADRRDVFPNQKQDCFVLLAACEKHEKAGEDSQGGLFTQSILRKIKGMKSHELDQLSYHGLMRFLVVSKSQHPRYESSDLHRYLFRKEREDPQDVAIAGTIRLPPPIAEKPHKDLTGQVTKSPGVYIAYGELSEIYRGEWKNPETGSSTPVAIKLIRGVYRQDEDWIKISRHLNHETWVWDQLSDLNVLPFLGISNDAGETGSSPALITPLCTNGHVLNYLTQNPDADRLHLVVGVAKGLRYLHSKDIIHGDLKPTNILISNNGDAMLGDFGRSRIMRHKGSTTLAFGATGYQAPELIGARRAADTNEEVLSNESYMDREIFCDKLTTKTDVYAYAMVALEIFTEKSPFYYIMNDFHRATRIKRGEQLQRDKYNSLLLTDGYWTVLAECWAKNPMARPEIDLILPQLV